MQLHFEPGRRLSDVARGARLLRSRPGSQMTSPSVSCAKRLELGVAIRSGRVISTRVERMARIPQRGQSATKWSTSSEPSMPQVPQRPNTSEHMKRMRRPLRARRSRAEPQRATLSGRHRHGEPQPGAELRTPACERHAADVRPEGCAQANATFRVPQLDWECAADLSATESEWRGGAAPADFEELLGSMGDILGETATDASSRGRIGDVTTTIACEHTPSQRRVMDKLTVEVSVEISERVSHGRTQIVLTIESLGELRARRAGEADYLAPLQRRLRVSGPGYGEITFRVRVHPNVDATGNLYVSFQLEKADGRLASLELRYELCVVELLADTSRLADGAPRRTPPKTEVLRGTRAEFQQALGVAGQPTDFPLLRGHEGRLTLTLQVSVDGHTMRRAVEADHVTWHEFASPKFRYLLISSSGEPDVEDDAGDGDSAASYALDAHLLRAHLLRQGVGSDRILLLDYDGRAKLRRPLVPRGVEAKWKVDRRTEA
ncbi:unnamed protein product [Prorocentrum cordatum]|uniref:Uncharacterized protein n=1 Tax=Prorocentrum cordatum TaxID=2364126 RepID=A0ABN9UTC4_9DINO|nr:unnamed protein product [Polarella glacialis]